MRANAYVMCLCACSVMCSCMLRAQNEFTGLNLAYAYAVPFYSKVYFVFGGSF